MKSNMQYTKYEISFKSHLYMTKRRIAKSGNASFRLFNRIYDTLLRKHNKKKERISVTYMQHRSRRIYSANNELDFSRNDTSRINKNANRISIQNAVRQTSSMRDMVRSPTNIVGY